MPILSAAEVAQLVKQAGFPADVHVTMVAIAKGESGFRTEAVGGPNKDGTYDRGIFQISDVHGLDRSRLVSDASYNTAMAKRIFDSQGLRAWAVYTSGKWRQYENEARQGVAQAASVVGNPAVAGSPDPTSRPAVTYGPPGPQLTAAGVGTPLAAAGVIPGPLQGLRIIGTEVTGDFSAVVIGKPKFAAGWDIVPNLQFTVADPQGDLLWHQRLLWRRGARVAWSDLDMRIDEITFAPGGHTTGQLEISAIDAIVYALMNLRGERIASGVSAVTWLAQELTLAGIDPGRYLLGEAVPTQSEIARDIPDSAGQTGSGDVPSAWTTIVRLAKELGRRVFISGARIVFGSAGFAARWAAPGDLRIGWHDAPEGRRWQTLPSGRQTSIGNRSGLTEVTGRVPHNRAQFFRPGASVVVHNTPSIAAGDRAFVVSRIEHELANDTDGADITLNEPVDAPPAPPTSNEAVNSGPTGSGAATSGGGADGQVDQFVNLALRQVGKTYRFGAEAGFDDPDPKAFDCCLTGDTRVWTAGHGFRPVTEIRVGDLVLGCDLAAGNTLVARPVVAWARQRPRLVHRVTTRDHTVDATGNHPFLRAVRTPRKRGDQGYGRPVEWTFRWTPAGTLRRGDLLVMVDNAVPEFGYYPETPRLSRTPFSHHGLRAFLPEPWWVQKVRRVDAVGTAETFDIQVEDISNFVAEGLCVSNSELIEWAAARVGISPRVPDGSSAQINHCRSIPVRDAINTKGALLWRSGHIAISLGNGSTVEAANSRAGVVQGSAGTRFTRGGLIPGARGYR